MKRLTAIPLLATILATSQTGGCDSTSSHKTVPGSSPGIINCTETPVDSDSGISISRGIITGSMQVACTGGRPDTFDFRMILVRNQAMLDQSGNQAETTIPDDFGYTVTRIAACTPGTWHIYYLVTWTKNGQAVHNTTTTTTDRQVVLDDC